MACYFWDIVLRIDSKVEPSMTSRKILAPSPYHTPSFPPPRFYSFKPISNLFFDLIWCADHWQEFPPNISRLSYLKEHDFFCFVFLKDGFAIECKIFYLVSGYQNLFPPQNRPPIAGQMADFRLKCAILSKPFPVDALVGLFHKYLIPHLQPMDLVLVQTPQLHITLPTLLALIPVRKFLKHTPHKKIAILEKHRLPEDRIR